MASNIIRKQHDILKDVIKTSVATLALYVGLTTCSKSGAVELCLRKWDNRFSDKRIEMMQEVEEKVGIDAEDNLNVSILHAVIKNEKLEDWEKNILYGFEAMLKDNPYINLRRSYNSLEKLDIIYTERTSEYSDTVYGVYIPDLDEIHMFQNKQEVNIEILKHELIHGVFKYNFTSLPDYFIEGTTEILANEYFSDNPFIETKTYPFEVEMVKLLCDMIGSDKVLEAYTKGDMNIIRVELAKTMGYKKSKAFLNDIDSFFVSFEKGETLDKSKFQKFMKIANSYLTNKYASTADQLVADKFFYSQDLLENMLSASPYEAYWTYLEENGVFTKVYFNKKLQEETSIRRINTDNTEYQSAPKVYTYQPAS